jgi:hypothetical protein
MNPRIPYADAGQDCCVETVQSNLKEDRKPTLRDRLEEKRSRLAAQLARVDEALRLLYTNPDAEHIAEVFNRV